MSIKTPEQIQELYEQALKAHDAEEFAIAIDLYNKVLAHVPDGDIIFYNLGVACFQAGDTAKAIEALTRALELSGEKGEYWFTLAQVYKEEKQYVEAIRAYKTALEFQSDDVEILYSLGCCCKEAGILKEAEKVFAHIVELTPEHTPSVNQLAYLAHTQGDLQRAEELYNMVLENDPSHPGARYMVQVLKGNQTSSPPREYVEQLFDNYATNFEQHLQGKLEYRVPELLYALFEQAVPKNITFQNALDLGCGTGLCGELFRRNVHHLSGVDLSSGMIEVAENKNCYDELEVAEIISFLNTSSRSYNLFLAADVFTYFGDLEPLFTALSEKSGLESYLCFSVERSKAENWEVQATGRFAHSHEYIMQIAHEHNYNLIGREHADLRKEKDQWIEGAIYIFSRIQ